VIEDRTCISLAAVGANCMALRHHSSTQTSVVSRLALHPVSRLTHPLTMAADFVDRGDIFKFYSNNHCRIALLVGYLVVVSLESL
jgi:hypothetical protein